MKKLYMDLRAGLILVAASLGLYFVLIPAQIRVRATATGVSAAFFPKLLAVVLGLCGLALAASALFDLCRNREQSRKEWQSGAWKTTYKTLLPHAVFLVAAIAYLFLMQYLGFILASVPFLIFLLWHFGSEGLLKNAALAVVYVPLVYYVFATWFRIRFPMGPFGF